MWVFNPTTTGVSVEFIGRSGPDSTGLRPYDFVELNGKVLFAGDNSSGAGGLWTTNGTVAGTEELLLTSGPGGVTYTDVESPAALNARLFSSDTTPPTFSRFGKRTAQPRGYLKLPLRGNLELLLALNPSISPPTTATSIIGTLNGKTYGLISTDGVDTTQIEVTGTSTGGYGLVPDDLTPFEGYLLFTGFDSTGNRSSYGHSDILWQSTSGQAAIWE